MSDSYNGWTNYETWCCALWIDNEESSYRLWNASAHEAWEEAEAGHHYASQTKAQHAVSILAEAMKDSFEEGVPGDVHGFYADLLTSALQAVNWLEIARAKLEELEEEAKENEAKTRE